MNLPDPTPDRDRDQPLLQPRRSRPPEERWCVWCHGDRAHEPTCPLVLEFVEGLATAVAMDAVTKAMNKEKR